MASAAFSLRGPGTWQFSGWAGPGIIAGTCDKRASAAELTAAGQLQAAARIQAQQVHGASVCLVGPPDGDATIPGCDALATAAPGVALLMRTADCLPVFLADPRRRVIGIAHAGWRGLAARIPQRLIGALSHGWRVPPEELHAAIGPAIRSCCYEVREDVASCFPERVARRGGRLMCDLIAEASAQLSQAGVPPERISDAGRCTACEADWWSVRRDGSAAGRLTSFIMMPEEAR